MRVSRYPPRAALRAPDRHGQTLSLLANTRAGTGLVAEQPGVRCSAPTPQNLASRVLHGAGPYRGPTPSTRFCSSPIAVRSHCGECGTPIALTYDGRDAIALTVGTANAPATLEPSHHYGCEGPLTMGGHRTSLPAEETKEQWWGLREARAPQLSEGVRSCGITRLP
jgi:hypothetical protein